MIRKTGRYLGVDKAGFIVPDVSQDLIPEKWQELINAIIAFTEEYEAHNVVALYVRGSVPRGLAIEGVSDLDLLFIVRNADTALSEHVLSFKKALLERYPFCNGIEWSIDPLPDMNAIPLRSEDRHLARLIKTQALHLWGQDLASSFPKVKPGVDMVSHAFGLAYEWQAFPARMRAASQTRCDQLCLWMGKRLLRTAFELVALDKPLFTRDLYLCYETAATEYPEIASELYEVLALSLQQNVSADAVITCFSPVADFLSIKINGLMERNILSAP